MRVVKKKQGAEWSNSMRKMEGGDGKNWIWRRDRTPPLSQKNGIFALILLGFGAF